ncbi:hypothetical protein FE783_12755 [Paenibacillus mesophilus]|uniref:hypothetical protein n=1 Tax=Paenibacillus mesophilus TaxID=2582849 RepID=UPI00110DD588|nr:hypothetical protein [Paenibacillus mesophilus]TMV49379.1 hypothetical protein FE783_12755 [Paenibacillus mesophilus]
MLASGFVLRSDHHFRVAMHNNLPVEVWLSGKLHDYGGPIEVNTDDMVKINGLRFAKVMFEFRIR